MINDLNHCVCDLRADAVSWDERDSVRLALPRRLHVSHQTSLQPFMYCPSKQQRRRVSHVQGLLGLPTVAPVKLLQQGVLPEQPAAHVYLLLIHSHYTCAS